MRIVLTVIQVIASAGIIALVLLQRGKGADAGAGFGAGASGTVFGARGATTALSRATAIFAAIFMLNSLALAYMGTRQSADHPKTILEEAAGANKSAPAKGLAPAPAGTNGSANGSVGAPASTGAPAAPSTAPSTGAPAPAPATAPAAPTTPPK